MYATYFSDCILVFFIIMWLYFSIKNCPKVICCIIFNKCSNKLKATLNKFIRTVDGYILKANKKETKYVGFLCHIPATHTTFFPMCSVTKITQSFLTLLSLSLSNEGTFSIYKYKVSDICTL